MATKRKTAGVLAGLLTVSCLGGRVHGQDTATLRALHAFADSSGAWLEGYGSAGNENSFAYQSLQPGCSDAMITRATEGVMPIVWNTAAVPATYPLRRGATFLFLVDRDMGETKVFDLFVNGTKKFSFGRLDRPDWTIRSGDGGKLSYATFARDVYGDSRGYMLLHAPASWLRAGEPLHLKISAVPASSQAWFMVFKAPDAAAFLRKRLAYESFFRVECRRAADSVHVRLMAPGFASGRSLVLQLGAKRRRVAGRRTDSAVVYSTTFLFSRAGQLKVYDGKRLVCSTDTLFAVRSSRTIRERGMVFRRISSRSPAYWEEELVLSYRPQLATRLRALSENYSGAGSCLLMNSSHQDIAWMDAPEKCILMRDTLVITPMLRRMERDTGYHFDLEDVLMVREYIKRHPGSVDEIRRFLEDGQLNVGGSFNMPYEDMYGGESLVREFYQGARWMQQRFHYRPVTYWNVDVPGKTLQMPQILREAGIGMMVVSRMRQGLYRWAAPDGSSVLAYSPGHYNDLYAAFQGARDPYAGLSTVAAVGLEMGRRQDSVHAGRLLVPLLWDSDMLGPGDDDGFPADWNNLRTMTDSSGASVPLRLPPVHSSTSRDLYHALKDYPQLASLRGERPDVWVYIHGPSHEKALHASRDADILLPAAEKFLTVEALLAGDPQAYPSARLRRAWEAKIYPDHGWGGYHGDITDGLFLQKFRFAREEGRNMLDEAIRGIAGRIRFAGISGTPVVVFNSLSWARRGPVDVQLHFREGEAFSLGLVDDSGKAVPLQLTDESRYGDHSLASATLCFIAGVPAVGYRTYHVVFRKKRMQEEKPDHIATGAVFESRHYRIRLGNGGLASIFDKDLHAELLRTDKFLGGEVFTMRSVGNGAGEFADIQQPDMQGFDKTSLHRCPWKIVSDGPVYTAFSYTCPLKYAEVRQTVVLYKQLKRIDFRTDLLNWQGVLYREFREAFPMRMNGGGVDYSVPFGVLHVGRDELHRPAGERYKTDCRLVHPRGIDAWIGVADPSHTATLSSDVAVADYVDPTPDPVTYPVLQPLLLASRKSCNSRGNEYLQTGDHHFTFSLVSSGPDSLRQDRSGLSGHVPFFAVVNPPAYAAASLPETKSFAAVSGSAIITAIKKAEDGDGVCFRLYNASGVPVHASLHFFLPLSHTMDADLIENPLHPLASAMPGTRTLSLTLKPHEIRTLVSRISR